MLCTTNRFVWQMVEPGRRVAVGGSMPPHRPDATVHDYAALHRGLGGESHGADPGEEDEHDSLDGEWRRQGNGDSEPRGHAVLVPRKLGGGTL